MNNDYLHVTCADEAITSVASWTGAVVTVDHVVTRGYSTAAAIISRTLVNVCTFM